MEQTTAVVYWQENPSTSSFVVNQNGCEIDAPMRMRRKEL